MTSLGESCSRFERRADDASRDAADWLKCEYLMKHIGQQFHGIVTSVTSFGLFVQLEELLIDGLVHVTALKRDYYRFDPVRHQLVGEMSKRCYQLGDRLLVEVVRVDMEDRKIDFDLVTSLSEGGEKGKKPNKSKPHKSSKKGRSGTRDKQVKRKRKK
jgi:ribonuclease R